MWPLTVDARIRKRRYVVPHGGHHWEIDVFLDRELVVAEIELRHEHDPVELPSWLTPYIVRDVTGEVQYFNAVLARAEGALERATA
jgi:CYTH domain-containing protein